MGIDKELANASHRVKRFRAIEIENKRKRLEKLRDYNKRYYQTKKLEIIQKQRVKRRIDSLKQKYNLTPEEFQAKLESQSNCCAICLHNDHRSSNWHVDHSHRTNLVRGILCGQCNTMLGMAKESQVTLYRAIDYLKEWSAKEVS